MKSIANSEIDFFSNVIGIFPQCISIANREAIASANWKWFTFRVNLVINIFNSRVRQQRIAKGVHLLADINQQNIIISYLFAHLRNRRKKNCVEKLTATAAAPTTHACVAFRQIE